MSCPISETIDEKFIREIYENMTKEKLVDILVDIKLRKLRSTSYNNVVPEPPSPPPSRKLKEPGFFSK